jgi:two-component system LytT family response regulator
MTQLATGSAVAHAPQTPYRVVIADDEPLARRGVRARLCRNRAFTVECECATGEEAIAAIKELSPDLVFLDVQMPGISGIDVARVTANRRLPAIIFTTAYAQYALSAFEAHAIDYLLKPLDDVRFARALERAQWLIEASANTTGAHGATAHPGPEAPLERFWVKTCGKVVLVPVSDVDWIAAEGDYARLHVRERSYLINASLTGLEPRLAAANFVRIHRSTIVNVARVAELRPHLNQDHIVRLTSGVELKLSRTFYRRFIEHLR